VTLPPTRNSRLIENSSPIANSSRMTPSSASVSVVERSATNGMKVRCGPTSNPASK
jgi:hypothetical protein